MKARQSISRGLGNAGSIVFKETQDLAHKRRAVQVRDLEVHLMGEAWDMPLPSFNYTSSFLHPHVAIKREGGNALYRVKASAGSREKHRWSRSFLL
jgi:hypothetical protein